MTKPTVKHDAFRQAQLKSERLRILIIIAGVTTIVALRILGTVLVMNDDSVRVVTEGAFIAAIFVSIELWMLREVRRALNGGPDLPRWAWIGSLIFEASLPAIGLAFLTGASVDFPYRPVANAAVLWFFLFIIVSTLRLNPNHSRLAGIVAALSYLAAALHLGWRPSLDSGVSILAPQRVVISYAIAYVVGGFVAGAVAEEIRKHLNAALREAEVKRELDKLTHDLQTARNIQQSLLPNSVPEVAGFEIAGWNQPADETGGDYFDWQPLSEDKCLVVLADVTGHGIGSALLAAVCRAYARASFSVEEELRPAMERINTQLAGDLKSGLFVTFVAAICAPGESRVKLLSAGHGPLFFYVLREDRFDQKEAQGLPLGISASFQSEPELIVDLHPGDLIVLTTDGFFEWANPAKEHFGAERMQQSVRSARHLPPAEIISTLYRDVLAFSGGTRQEDDLTAVIIKRQSLPA
jgi:serine phosphatase RsbU (regulator of sigma subunit)